MGVNQFMAVLSLESGRKHAYPIGCAKEMGDGESREFIHHPSISISISADHKSGNASTVTMRPTLSLLKRSVWKGKPSFDLLCHLHRHC